MPLTNRYLKYSPEITLEIFALVWDKLIKSGLKCDSYNTKVNSNYEFFKKGFEFLVTSDTNLWTLDNNLGKSEITAQEILEYNPFVKEDVITEYIEFTSDINDDFKKGFIYEVREDGRVIDSDGDFRCEYSTYLQLGEAVTSTKEAFDAQFKPKQPLKQAVYCKTQEEYKFAKETLGAIFNSNAYVDGESIIPLDAIGSTVNLNRFGDSVYNDYQLLSFQEWCDLNGYKMESKCEFIVGRWYKMNDYWYLKYKGKDIVATDKIYMSECIDSTFNHKYDNGFVTYLYEQKTWRLASLEEIQQYLPDNHPDKITPVIQQVRDMQKANQEFKVGDWCVWRAGDKVDVFKVYNIHNSGNRIHGDNGNHYDTDKVRHATPEEINNHLISIGQIPVGEPLNTGIEPNKDGMFKYKSTVPGSYWSGLTPTNHLGAMYPGDIMGKPISSKMTLSIDDEELPMVSIIKTNSIKQLLNND